MLDKILLPSFVILFLVKLISLNLTTFNLFGDEAQYWLWSKDIDFGYFSKPPFLAWAIRIYSEIFGESFISLKLFPSCVYLLVGWSVYKLLNNSGLKPKDSFSGCIIFLFIPAVSFSSFIISTDIFLLLFWTLSLNEIICIKKEQNFKSFILLGIFIGLGFLSKYAAVYFLICLLLLIFIDKNYRKIFFNNIFGFSLSLLCALIIIIPNIIWNINNDWITIQHTSDNANFKNIDIDLLRGLEFLLLQLFMIGPILFLGGVINILRVNYTQKLLLVFSLPIIFIVFLEAVIVRANANWAAPALISLFVCLYVGMQNSVFKTINFLFNFSFCIIFFIMIGMSYPSNLFNRVNGLNEYANKIFNTISDGSVENIVVSDRLLFSSLSYELRNKKISFYMPHKKGAEITNHFKMMSPLKEKMKKDFILIGAPTDINYLENEYILIKKNSPAQKFTNKKLDVYEVVFK